LPALYKGVNNLRHSFVIISHVSIRGRNLTPELTGREAPTSCDKLTMTSELFPLRLNELLDRITPITNSSLS
jgi:hypothetical protein